MPGGRRPRRHGRVARGGGVGGGRPAGARGRRIRHRRVRGCPAWSRAAAPRPRARPVSRPGSGRPAPETPRLGLRPGPRIVGRLEADAAPATPGPRRVRRARCAPQRARPASAARRVASPPRPRRGPRAARVRGRAGPGEPVVHHVRGRDPVEVALGPRTIVRVRAGEPSSDARRLLDREEAVPVERRRLAIPRVERARQPDVSPVGGGQRPRGREVARRAAEEAREPGGGRLGVGRKDRHGLAVQGAQEQLEPLPHPRRARGRQPPRLAARATRGHAPRRRRPGRPR